LELALFAQGGLTKNLERCRGNAANGTNCTFSEKECFRGCGAKTVSL
jgi:hypothetical protein